MNLTLGESRKISYEWAQELERATANLSTSEWSYDGTATLSGDAITGTKASVLFAPETDGVLTNKATFSDGQIFYQQWEVTIV